MALSTTWTQRDANTFSQSTLSTTANLTSRVEANIKRGTLTTSTTPTTTDVTAWLVQAKEIMIEKFGFTWSRKFVYASTAAGTYQYALPADFAGGGTVLRDLTQNKRLDFTPPITFDTLYPDVAGNSNSTPKVYTIKDRELWLQDPADGVYTLELEYQRSGEDSTAETWDYLPEAMLFKLADYATFRAFLSVHQWNAANIYKAIWEESIGTSRKSDGKKKWAQLNYQCLNWHNMK